MMIVPFTVGRMFNYLDNRHESERADRLRARQSAPTNSVIAYMPARLVEFGEIWEIYDAPSLGTTGCGEENRPPSRVRSTDPLLTTRNQKDCHPQTGLAHQGVC